MDFYDLLFLVLIVWLGFIFYRSITESRRRKESAAAQAATSAAASKSQMTEDIKSTQTSRIADAIEILDELGGSKGGYRHYCELVGTAMRENGVTAPYSNRQVAYYDVKCFRIDHVNGVDRETLVAHEKSIDPFCFYDDSCDTPVYVDISSFGNNVILVNSTNHIEGPNSDFSKAFSNNSGSPSSGGTGTVTAFSATPVESMGNFLAGKVKDAVNTLRRALRPGPAIRPQFALAGAGASTDVATDNADTPSNVMFSGYNNIPKGFGHPGAPKIPKGMRDFMGNGYGGIYHIPVRTYQRSSDMGDILVGMTLSALLRSLNTTTYTQTSRPVTNTTPPTPTPTFRGYRIVEDVVPLGSPTYCIGEMYRHGTDIYMGKSSDKEYSTSFFACRPEAEVLSAINS